ncbi:hypothetical protein [Streptomyces sp. NRRL S-495]|uniref:hypothetical protein n=1 Tax=Streptomyces sp. NRRL S-495 TaxID=1609133 RepID=UPI0005F8A159|nr:hypothetical protein [Streptomyces sp. NRRL S-495]KJY26503.1 hypothetical protein VR45_36905 [Streptomyces sp. NRRL S-495]
MSGQQRVVVGVTGLAVGVLAGVFCFLSWDRANQVAGIVSALVAVLALGVAVWTVMAGTGGGSVRVSETGSATAKGQGSRANSGLATSGGTRGEMVVERTGDVNSEDGGIASTGYVQQ